MQTHKHWIEEKHIKDEDGRYASERVIDAKCARTHLQTHKREVAERWQEEEGRDAVLQPSASRRTQTATAATVHDSGTGKELPSPSRSDRNHRESSCYPY